MATGPCRWLGCAVLRLRNSQGTGLRKLCDKLNILPVLSYGTGTDTGRLADLLAAVSAALGGVPMPDLPVAAVAPEYMEQKATIEPYLPWLWGYIPMSTLCPRSPERRIW